MQFLLYNARIFGFSCKPYGNIINIKRVVDTGWNVVNYIIYGNQEACGAEDAPLRNSFILFIGVRLVTIDIDFKITRRQKVCNEGG